MLLEQMIQVEEVRNEPSWATTNAAAMIVGIAAGISIVVFSICCFFAFKWARAGPRQVPAAVQNVLPGIGPSSRTVLFRY